MAGTGRSSVLQTALDFQSTVTAEDLVGFQHTTLGDVQQAIYEVEDLQAARLSLQNLRRIEPLLLWLKDYSAVMDTFCQGFSPMAFVWVRVTLKSASESTCAYC
jgi:hypothetical protein